MKYYATFVNGKASCYWKLDKDDAHPIYIKKEEIREITKEQHDSITHIILDGDVVKFDQQKYDQYLARKLKKNKKREIAEKIRGLSNSKIKNLTREKKDNLLIYLIDAVFGRDEILEDSIDD